VTDNRAPALDSEGHIVHREPGGNKPPASLGRGRQADLAIALRANDARDGAHPAFAVVDFYLFKPLNHAVS
jgi:hypothetical protein